MKFVSKSSCVKTKYASGQDVVDIKETAIHGYYADFMVGMEAYQMQAKHLETLTCQSCGVQKKNDCDGFDDKNFNRKETHRWCIECTAEYHLVRESFEVGGRSMFRCGAGGCIEPVELRASKDEQANLEQNLKGTCRECLQRFTRGGAPRALWYSAEAGKICKLCCEGELERLKCCRNAKCRNPPCLVLSEADQVNAEEW
jgi:hypothetical protein